MQIILQKEGGSVYLPKERTTAANTWMSSHYCLQRGDGALGDQSRLFWIPLPRHPFYEDPFCCPPTPTLGVCRSPFHYRQSTIWSPVGPIQLYQLLIHNTAATNFSQQLGVCRWRHVIDLINVAHYLLSFRFPLFCFWASIFPQFC